jgi:hypothetical protein
METGFAEYLARRRAKAIGRYREATLWVHRREGRNQALHYGRLLRMIKGAKT